LGPAAGLPVPTSASAALLGLGLTPGAVAATSGATAAAHSLSMLGKPDIHRGQPDDLKSNGGESSILYSHIYLRYLSSRVIAYCYVYRMIGKFSTFVSNCLAKFLIVMLLENIHSFPRFEKNTWYFALILFRL